MPSLILYSVSTGRFAFKDMDSSLGWDPVEWWDDFLQPGSNIPSEPGPEPDPDPEPGPEPQPRPASPTPAPTHDLKPTRVTGNNSFGALGTESCAACRKRKGRVDAHT